MTAIADMPLHAISEQIRAQTLSPVAVVDACLTRIEQRNGALNAFITVLADQAREQAVEAERAIRAGAWRGPLHGVPVAFKDMYDTAGIRTTAAFEHFRDRVPAADARSVHLLRAAGAIIIGKTNMHTLAMGTTSQISFYGPVRNPWNQAYVAGGSSGGSAAAVASGMCYATVDTDAIGSTRLPAACCGVVGYKCTWGLIDNSGILADQPADDFIIKMATAGIITRDVADTTLLLDALTDSAQGAIARQNHSLRIGVAINGAVSETVRRSVHAAAAVFSKDGYTTRETTVPLEIQPDMERIDAVRKTADGSLFRDADLLVLPTTGEVPTAAAVGDDPQGVSAQHTFFVNYYGLPAVSVPCGFDERGLPIGVQIVGKRGDDAAVLRAALAYQRATPWHMEHPAP